MNVVDRKPVPIYETECVECKSKIQYKASEVSLSYIICPVCGMSIWANTIKPVKMEDDRPLVEVPKPHGRLIDVDVLMNKLQELYDERECEARYTGSKGPIVSWNDAVYQIVDAPIVIPADDKDIKVFEKEMRKVSEREMIYGEYLND